MKGFKGGPIKEDRFRDNCRSIGINVCNVYLDSIYSRRTINYAGGIINNRRCHAETLHSLAPRRDENSFLQEGRKGGEEGERSLRMTRVRIYIYIYINMRVQGREIRRRGGEIEADTYYGAAHPTGVRAECFERIGSREKWNRDASSASLKRGCAPPFQAIHLSLTHYWDTRERNFDKFTHNSIFFRTDNGVSLKIFVILQRFSSPIILLEIARENYDLMREAKLFWI